VSLHTESSRDLENQRQQSLQEYESQSAPSALEDFRPGTFGSHELLDRTSLLAEQIEHAILSHPSCLQNREWYQLAWEAFAALRELYQRIGSEHLNLPDEAPGPH
jgi:hypothetical protein